jgi:lipopolysaccharide biosynthesis glycosyltransferase
VRNEKYNYHHKDVHYGWNACGGYKKRVGNKLISDGLPEKHDIYVLHYWDEFKPWNRPC